MSVQYRSDIRRLQIVRALRSIGQGALLVTFAIYLGELGWPATRIGTLLSVGGLLNAALSVPIGLASDRIGRKGFVMANEAVIIAAGLMATFSSHPVLLTIASLMGAFGRGQVGMVGPAGPAEEAWMAVLTRPKERGRIYSNTAGYNFVGMGIGSLATGLIALWSPWLPGTLAYRPFFAFVVLTGVINLILLAKTRSHGIQHKVSEATDPAHPAIAQQRPSGPTQLTTEQTPSSVNPAFAHADERTIRRFENRLMIKLGAVNAVNAFAIGLTAPLLAYWFHLKFETGPDSLGPVFALTYFATAVASITTGRVAERIGLVRSIVSVRLTAVLLLILLPIVPFFWAASLIHIVRSALNRGTAGTRQALAVNLVREQRRGFASSMNSISASLPNALGPVIAGLMLDHGQLTLPFLVAAVLQFAYGILFMRMFQAYDPNAPSKDTTQKRTSSPGSMTIT